MHLTRDAIRMLLTERAGEPLPEHVDRCPACSAAAGEVVLDLGLDDELAWKLASLPELPACTDIDPLEVHVRELLGRGASGVELVRDPRLASDAGLFALLHASHSLLSVDPARLRAIAEAVLALDPPDAVTVVALRELANAQRRTGDLAGALSSIERGREAANRLVVSEHELAIFDYIEAIVRVDQSELASARALAERALPTFRRFGDTRRALYAHLALGGIDYETGAFEAARERFLEIAPPLAKLGDHAASLDAILNAGDCSRQLHDLVAARRCFLEAKAGYVELGLQTPLLTIDWVLARIALEEGHLDEAEQTFLAVARGHDLRGMKLDAALTRLDLVELYRGSGRQDDAVALTRELASVFAVAGARGRLADALTILREAAESGAMLDEPLREAREALVSAPSTSFFQF
ncbi:MAG: tetratricopeptide repeat protein [Thermoanaerobaculia bacterium]